MFIRKRPMINKYVIMSSCSTNKKINLTIHHYLIYKMIYQNNEFATAWYVGSLVNKSQLLTIKGPFGQFVCCTNIHDFILSCFVQVTTISFKIIGGNMIIGYLFTKQIPKQTKIMKMSSTITSIFIICIIAIQHKTTIF